MRPTLVLSILISSVAIADNASVDLAWKARGLQAQERVAELTKKMKNSKLTPDEKCELRSENAYFSFAVPQLKDMVNRQLKKGVVQRVIGIANTNAKSGADVLMIGVTYAESSVEPEGYSVVNLPVTYAMLANKGSTDIWNFSDKECFFQFGLGEPLKIHPSAR